MQQRLQDSKLLQDSTSGTSQLVSRSYDFVKTMSGIENETQQKLHEVVGHDIRYMFCLSH